MVDLHTQQNTRLNAWLPGNVKKKNQVAVQTRRSHYAFIKQKDKRYKDARVVIFRRAIFHSSEYTECDSVYFDV